MSTYQVNSELIATATTGVHKSMGVITTEVASLMAQLTSLQESWQGAASQAFATVAGQWQTTQQQVEESLTSINQALSIAGQNYNLAEEEALRMFTPR
jgi:WXG100 family type VII secretion target